MAKSEAKKKDHPIRFLENTHIRKSYLTNETVSHQLPERPTLTGKPLFYRSIDGASIVSGYFQPFTLGWPRSFHLNQEHRRFEKHPNDFIQYQYQDQLSRSKERFLHGHKMDRNLITDGRKPWNRFRPLSPSYKVNKLTVQQGEARSNLKWSKGYCPSLDLQIAKTPSQGSGDTTQAIKEIKKQLSALQANSAQGTQNPDIAYLTQQVYEGMQNKLRIERERRGL
jgi:hypothetical protein